MTLRKLILLLSTFILFFGTILSNRTASFAHQNQSSTAPPNIDFSQVNWTELGRFMYGKCGEYHDLALLAGWPKSQWPTLSKVMYRESRCNPLSFNRSDPNGGSRGLIQINGYWCRKSRWSTNGWLQDRFVLNNCQDLFDPYTNLRAGWEMWQYSQNYNGCGWKPWATRCK